MYKPISKGLRTCVSSGLIIGCLRCVQMRVMNAVEAKRAGIRLNFNFINSGTGCSKLGLALTLG